MDYKTLHGSASQAASSRSIVGSGRTKQASRLHSALPEGAFGIIDEVEGLLVGVETSQAAAPGVERQHGGPNPGEPARGGDGHRGSPHGHPDPRRYRGWGRQ